MGLLVMLQVLGKSSNLDPPELIVDKLFFYRFLLI